MRDRIQATCPVIESACTISIVVELICHRCKIFMYRDGTEKLHELTCSLLSDGKGHITTDVYLTIRLEEIGEWRERRGTRSGGGGEEEWNLDQSEEIQRGRKKTWERGPPTACGWARNMGIPAAVLNKGDNGANEKVATRVKCNGEDDFGISEDVNEDEQDGGEKGTREKSLKTRTRAVRVGACGLQHSLAKRGTRLP